MGKEAHSVSAIVFGKKVKLTILLKFTTRIQKMQETTAISQSMLIVNTWFLCFDRKQRKTTWFKIMKLNVRVSSALGQE